MPKTRMGAGAEVETLNQHELAEVLTQQTAAWFQEQARGYTTPRFGNSATVTGGNVMIPADDSDRFGPDQGFAWRVTRVSADGLSTNDVLKVYRNGTVFLGTVTATSSLSPGKGIILRGGEYLVLRGSSLTATGDITVTGEAAQSAELDIYKIL